MSIRAGPIGPYKETIEIPLPEEWPAVIPEAEPVTSPELEPEPVEDPELVPA